MHCSELCIPFIHYCQINGNSCHMSGWIQKFETPSPASETLLTVWKTNRYEYEVHLLPIILTVKNTGTFAAAKAKYCEVCKLHTIESKKYSTSISPVSQHRPTQYRKTKRTTARGSSGHFLQCDSDFLNISP